MPHTNRKNRNGTNYQHAKRVHREDMDGWTHVVNSKGPNTEYSNLPVQPDDHSISPAELPDGETLDKVQSRFERHRSRWEQSTCWTGLKSVLSQQYSSVHNPPNLERVVCIALGSPCGLGRRGTADTRSRSMNQLAALLSISNHLANLGGKILPIFVQDPVFNDMDIQFLHSLGIEVLQHPEAFERTQNDTLVYAPAAEAPHCHRLAVKDPAILIGGPTELLMDSKYWDDKVESFVTGCSKTRFPPFNEGEYDFWNLEILMNNRSGETKDPICKG